MFSIGDTVLYGNCGVCRIVGTKDMKVASETLPFYVLQPVFRSDTTVYLPVGNGGFADEVRRVLSADEILALIRSMPDHETDWVEDEPERKERYKSILSGDDRAALVRMVRTLYLRNQELKDAGRGKKLHASDEKFMKDAENVLFDEFAFVLGIRRDDVLPFIAAKVGDVPAPARS